MSGRRVGKVKVAVMCAVGSAFFPLAGCGKSPKARPAVLDRSVGAVVAPAPQPLAPQPLAASPRATSPPDLESTNLESPRSAGPTATSASDPPPSQDKPVQTELSGGAPAETEGAANDPSFRMFLPTTSGPLIVDVKIQIGDQTLEAAFDARIADVMDQARGESSDLSWSSLLNHVAADPQQFGRSSPINSQQHRDLIRRYDKNRNQKPEHGEVATFLFRDAGFAGPFRLFGSDSFRQVNRSQSAVFAALDENSNFLLESGEVGRASESLRRLDQNADERIDVSEIKSVTANADAAWKNRGAHRWGQVAMDFTGYVDWSMLGYTLDEMPRGGPFGRAENALVMLDRDASDSIDRDEASDLLSVEPDLRLSVRYPLVATDQAQIEITSISSDLESLVEYSRLANQIRVAGKSLRLIASLSELPMVRNQIPPQAFAMLDENNDGGVDESEIPEGVLGEYSFDDLDQDADGKLSLQEINEGMSPKTPIWNVQVRARGAEAPDGVFAWLDNNHDHFLSTREIKDAGERLRAVASPEGSVRPSDIPDSYLLQFGRGDPAQDVQLFSFTPPRFNASDGVMDAWPRWALSMDTNRDGEISRQEFPGTRRQFDELDQTADGFIDISELSLEP